MENKPGSSTQIESSLGYYLHTLSSDAAKIISIMNDLGVKSSVKVVSKDKSMRGMWIDYVQEQMPYDGNDCKCIEDTNGCGSNGDIVKTPPSTSPPPHPTHPTSNHGSTVSAPVGGIHTNTSESTIGSIGRSHGSNSSLSSNKVSTSSSSSWNWVFVVIAGGIIFLAVRFGRRSAARPEFGNDLEMQVSPPPGYGDVSGGAGGYGAPHLGRYV